MKQGIDELTFEEAFAELQAAIEELRGDRLTLDRSLLLYERGSALAIHCTALLTTASLRITNATPYANAPSESPVSNGDW